MDEIWKQVTEYPAYEVSDLGRVRRAKPERRWPSGHILKPGSADSGHLYVMISKGPGNKAKKQYVHRLVATAFIGDLSDQHPMVLHHDDNPKNNVPDNLYWGNKPQNVLDAILNRKAKVSIPEVSQPGALSGIKNHSAVLTESDVHQIRRYLKMKLCGSCIAKLYGITGVSVYAIAKKKTWAALPEE